MKTVASAIALLAIWARIENSDGGLFSAPQMGTR